MQATLRGEKSQSVHPQIARQWAEAEKHRPDGQRQWTIDDPTIVYLVLWDKIQRSWVPGMCLTSVCSGWVWFRLTWAGETVAESSHVLSKSLSVIHLSTTLWLAEVASTILTKCHLSGRGMSTANVEQKQVIPALVTRAEHSWVWFGQKRICAKSDRSSAAVGHRSQWPGKNVEQVLLSDWDLLIRSIQSHLLSIQVDHYENLTNVCDFTKVEVLMS